MIDGLTRMMARQLPLGRGCACGLACAPARSELNFRSQADSNRRVASWWPTVLEPDSVGAHVI